MKREASKLLSKSLDSLVLSIEHFNRPYEKGRTCVVLIMLDHAMEMLLKAALVQRRNNIQNKDRPGQTIGFEICLGRAMHGRNTQFVSEEQAIVLRQLNGQRDAAQHYLVELSENLLYLHIQSGITVYREILRTVFDQELVDILPTRVLPVSASPPLDIYSLFESEISEIRKLMKPGKRKGIDVQARLRSLSIIDRAVSGGNFSQPSLDDLLQTEKQIAQDAEWQSVFPGVASIELVTDGTGHKISMYITKKELGIPVKIVRIEDSSANGSEAEDALVILKQVGDFDKYSMGLNRLAEITGLTPYQARAAIWYLRLQDNSDAYKEFKHNSLILKRYSKAAISAIRDLLSQRNIAEICSQFKQTLPTRRKHSTR